MPTINAINSAIDLTVQIFDRFNEYQQAVPAQEYDAVLSYFKSVFTTAFAAENMTNSLFRVAQETNADVLTLLQTFQQNGSSEPQVTILMAYYLNSVRSTSTLLGVLAPTTPNFYAARNIKA